MGFPALNLHLLLALALLAGLIALPDRPAQDRLTRWLSQDDSGYAQPASSSVAARTEQEALDAYGKLPLSFVPNAGQTDARVRYSAQASGASFAFTAKEALFAFTKGEKAHALSLRFLDTNAQAAPEGAEQLPGTVNYLLGNDPTAWRTGVSAYREVVYHDLWPGVDMVFRGEKGTLKYEFLVRPAARVADIRLAYRGAERLALDRRGDLLIGTSLGVLTDTRPVSHQVIDGTRAPVRNRFVLGRGGAYGFAVGAYDPQLPLVIDPGLVYSTYLGGSGGDQGFGIAVDALGNAYVAGLNQSANFPTTPGAFDTTPNGSLDAFVTKLNPAGTALVYSTYLGGNSDDRGFGIAVDALGNAYVAGQTGSANFPTTPGAFDTTFNGGSLDAFVTKLNFAGSGLLYSTYIGGSGDLDIANGIAVDTSGSAYATGGTSSTNFPTTSGAFDTGFNGFVLDAYVTKLNAAGSGLVYSTYLGGSNTDRAQGIALDAGGNAYVSGSTFSTNFPTTAGAFQTALAGNLLASDAFATKLNAAGNGLVYSTYLGGDNGDEGFGITLDIGGNAYVTGRTSATNFPATPGAFDTSYNGGALDAFVTKLNPAGTALVYSTYIGGNGIDAANGIAVDAGGNGYVTGITRSANFPTTAGAFDTTLSGAGDVFVTKLNLLGTAPLVYSTFLGGNLDDVGFGIILGASDSVYVTGDTESANFPTTPGAFDTTKNVSSDAFVTKLDTGAAPATLMLSPKTDTNTVGTPHTVTATVRDAGGNPVSGVTVRFSVSGANSASGSDVTDANGEATFTYTGTTAGTDAISAFADTDNDGTQDIGEPGDTATKIWTPGGPATLTLDPPADTNTVGKTHCVTATVRDALGNPVPGVTVRFSVPTATATAASPASGSATTDANGQASFCYSAALPGQDTIHAFADSDNDGMQDAAEPFGEAAKTWILPPSTAFCEVTITEGGWIVAFNGDQASFGGNARVEADGSVRGEQEYQDHGHAQPRNVHSIELTAATCTDDLTSATIFGRATVDGAGGFIFRIDVTDQGEPGTSDTYGIMLSDGYASGQQQLQGGNVQIHK